MMNADLLYDVIIIGCGPAGISAGIDLKKDEKIKFLLLDARDRVGGRVITDRTTFGQDTPVDLGAQWLHHYRKENPLYVYQSVCDPSQLNSHFILRSSTTPFFDIDGQRISNNRIEQAEAIFNRLSRLIVESSLETDQSMFEVIENELLHEISDPQLRRLVELLFGVVEQYEASNLDRLSSKSYLKSDGGIDEFNLALAQGFGTLIEKIVQHHELPVKLNSIVTRVEVTTDSFVQIYTADQRVYQCKYVLVTIPLGCLKRRTIEFLPSLPQWKENAIDQMGFGLSNKIFLQFPEIFWDHQWTSIFTTSSKFRFVLFHSDRRILLVKTCARVAAELEEQKDETILHELMTFLRKIFADRPVPDPTHFIITRWSQDPFAYGSYSNFAVGADNQTLKDLARECHQRIHWAGEHTNFDGTIGCVDSAFETGQREAKRLVQQLNADQSSNEDKKNTFFIFP